VPGEITSQLSHGTNGLLRLGATPVTCTADVLNALGIDPPPVGDPPALAGTAARVRAVVADAPLGADQLIRRTGLAPGELAAALAELELLGLVTQADGLYREVMPST
jgi:DNA processing protein